MSTSPETAVQLSGTSITGNNSGYPDYTFQGYTLRQAAWFKWIPKYGSPNSVFDATGSSFTTRVWVFLDGGEGDLVLIDNEINSKIIVSISSDETHYIVVAGSNNSQSGPFELLFSDPNLKIASPEEKLPVNIEATNGTLFTGFTTVINIERSFGGPVPHIDGAIEPAKEYVLSGGDIYTGSGANFFWWSVDGSYLWGGGPGQIPAVNTAAELKDFFGGGAGVVGQSGRHYANQGASFPSLYNASLSYGLTTSTRYANIPYVVIDEDNKVFNSEADWYDYDVWDPSVLNENPIDDNFTDPNYYARYGTNNVYTPRIPAEFISAQIRFFNVVENGSFPGATIALGEGWIGGGTAYQGQSISSYFSGTEIIHQGSITENLTINLSKNQVISNLNNIGRLYVHIIDSDSWSGNFAAVPDELPTYDSPGEYEVFKTINLEAELILTFKSPSFWYYYTVPLTAPPLRLAQRDDQLLGSARLDMTGTSTSEQSSIRLLGKGTYL